MSSNPSSESHSSASDTTQSNPSATNYSGRSRTAEATTTATRTTTATTTRISTNTKSGASISISISILTMDASTQTTTETTTLSLDSPAPTSSSPPLAAQNNILGQHGLSVLNTALIASTSFLFLLLVFLIAFLFFRHLQRRRSRRSKVGTSMIIHTTHDSRKLGQPPMSAGPSVVSQRPLMSTPPGSSRGSWGTMELDLPSLFDPPDEVDYGYEGQPFAYAHSPNRALNSPIRTPHGSTEPNHDEELGPPTAPYVRRDSNPLNWYARSLKGSDATKVPTMAEVPVTRPVQVPLGGSKLASSPVTRGFRSSPQSWILPKSPARAQGVGWWDREGNKGEERGVKVAKVGRSKTTKRSGSGSGSSVRSGGRKAESLTAKEVQAIVTRAQEAAREDERQPWPTTL